MYAQVYSDFKSDLVLRTIARILSKSNRPVQNDRIGYLRPSYFNDTLILAILASALTNAKFYLR